MDREFTFPNFLFENLCKKQHHLSDKFVLCYSLLHKCPCSKVIVHSCLAHVNTGQHPTYPMKDLEIVLSDVVVPIINALQQLQMRSLTKLLILF